MAVRTGARSKSVCAQNASQRLPGVRLLRARHQFRRPLRHDASAAFAAFRPQIDNPIGLLDDVQMMFDDQNRIAQAHQPLQHIQQLANVVEMQPGGRLVENI